MKKVTITNAYTWYNKGDAGILLGIVETLKKLYHQEVEFNVLSFTPEEDKKRYCEDKAIKNVYSNVLNPHPYKHTKVGKIIAIIKLFWQMLYQLIMTKFSLKKMIHKYDNYKALDDCDYIVICGGGFLGGKKFNSLMHLFQIYIDTKFNKKVIMMGTSIEPVNNKIIKYYTEKVLKKVDIIIARERVTFEYLKDFMPSDRIELIPDMAFMLKDESTIDIDILNHKKKYGSFYGITVRNWNFPNSKNPELFMNNYINSIVETISELVHKNNDLFIFVPQVIVEHGDDTEIAKKIYALLPKDVQDNFLIIEDDLSPIQIKALIGNMDYFIGTRMHSNIFATSMKIPTIAIAYEKKTNGIMETVGLSDFVIEIDEITSNQLLEKVEFLKENSEQLTIALGSRISNIRQEIIEKIQHILSEV